MKHDIQRGNDTTWINNSETGNNLARFGKFAWEINRPDGVTIRYSASMNASGGATDLSDWDKFAICVKFALNIELTSLKHRPNRLTKR